MNDNGYKKKLYKLKQILGVVRIAASNDEVPNNPKK